MKQELFEKPWRLKTNKIQYLIKGGELLKTFFEYEDKDNLCSQAWIASTVTSAVNGAEGLSMVETEEGEFFLKDLIEANPKQTLGTDHMARWKTSMGVLIKVLNSRDRLLVQAHPDAEKAKKYFHSDFGKTESWYVLDLDEKEKSHCIYAGFKPGVTREGFRHLIEVQDTAGILDCLYRFEIQKGQVILIPAGLPHALGAGSLIVEIQEPVDLTLRAERILPDGRVLPEESLHSGIGLEGLLDCFDFTSRTREQTEEKIYIAPWKKTESQSACEEILIGAAATCFGMNRIFLNGNERQTYEKENGAFTVVLVTKGKGKIKTGSGFLPLKKGTEVWLSHEIRKYCYETDAELEVVECYPPQS